MDFSSNNLLEIEEYLEYVSNFKKIRNKDLEVLLKNLNEENKKKFFYAYLSRVVDYAKTIYQKYQKYCGSHYSLMDLIQDGNLLLWDTLNSDVISESISKISLFNYAFHSRLTRKMLESFIVKKSFCFVGDYKKLLEGENKFYQEYGYFPNDNELSKYLGLNLKKINNIRGIFRGEISLYSKEALNMQEEELMENIIINKMYNQALCNEIMNSFLSDTEKEIVMLHFGICYNEEQGMVSYIDKMTFRELSQNYPYTNEWVRQNYKKSLVKLSYVKGIKTN